MRSLLRDEVRSIDRYAIEELGVPGAVLMENAGRNTAEAVVDFLEGADGKKVAVLAGAGNNAGDGFVIARHLKRHGADVDVYLASPREKIKGDAAVNLKIIEAMSLPVSSPGDDEIPTFGETLVKYDLIVDALGGTGIKGALKGTLAACVEQINAAGRAGTPVVSVDIPTGLDCDSGKAEGPAVRAQMTVTFLAVKKGFDEPSSKDYTGRVVLADIGIPAEAAAGAVGIEV